MTVNNLKPNKPYRVTKKIKIHTKPLREVEVTQEGLFVKETHRELVFTGFRCRKDCIVKVEEFGGAFGGKRKTAD